MIKGKISEIFESIQGEGLYLGERQIFVRFFGCNLNCSFCDTKLSHFEEYTPEELLAKILKFNGNYHSISFTGGEPLLQRDFLKDAMALTKKSGFKNYLETKGVLADELSEVIEYVDIIAMDFKLPSSTGCGEYWDEHRQFLKIASGKEVFVKAVISGSTVESDLNKAIKIIRETDGGAALVLQPDSNEDSLELNKKLEAFKLICEYNKVNSRTIPQFHKFLGVK